MFTIFWQSNETREVMHMKISQHLHQKTIKVNMSSKVSICRMRLRHDSTYIDEQQNCKSNLPALSDPKTPVQSRSVRILAKMSISLSKSIFWARSFSMFRLLSVLNLSSFMLLRTKVRTLLKYMKMNVQQQHWQQEQWEPTAGLGANLESHQLVV
jgi:hypothetical protein